MPPRKQCRENLLHSWLKNSPDLRIRGSKIFCTKCEISLVAKKYNVKKHLNSETHIKGTHMKNLSFYMDLTKFLITCNIAWHQLDNPNFCLFIQNCINGEY